MANRIQLRRGGAQEWQNANPTLAQGEIGIDLDTGRIKIGDGVTAWNTLKYERPVESITNTANTLVQRDADGNFSAGTITATLIGNASTAARLSSTRQIQLSGDVQATGVFDGSSNLNLNTTVSLVSTLPHYDGTNTSSGTYRSVTVDAKGRVTNATNPTTIQGYGLDGTVEGQSAQPYDLDLAAIAGLTTTGILARASGGNMQTRTVTGTAGRIAINNGDGVSGNPTIDLITTTISSGNYNTESLTSSTDGTETVNATKFTVDAYGRLTSATTVPIATATEGSKYANYDAGTAYSRYAIIQNASKVYQAIADINAGAGAPTHSSGDSGSWRYLAAEATEQKGLASFAQEDFDVDSNGHVTIAALGVDNTQLQNNRIGFADGNTVENFELDQELTATSGYRGFNYLNYVKVNDTSGNLLFGANNTGDSGAGEIDVNVRSYFSDPDITLDGTTNQTLDKTGDGDLTFQLTQNSGTDRDLDIRCTNAGSGISRVQIVSENIVNIQATDAAGKVHVEDARFQDNYIGTTNATMHLDPGDDRATSGLVRIHGDLQIDGTTTTVNSTTMQVDDPIITLGGDTAPSSNDTKDRGVEFRYYDTQARLGFYGWDNNYTDLGGHVGGYRFVHAATNISEVFIGTDSGIIAGNLKLTTGTASSSNTTGDLVVAGGVGITGAVNIGGNTDIDGTLRITSTSRFDDSIVLQGASKTLQLNNGSGTTKIELQSTTGNASIGGVTDITGNLNVNTNKFNVVAASGNTQIAGAVDANSTLNVAGFTHLEDTDEPTLAATGTDNAWEVQSNDYGSFRFDGGGYVEGDTLYNSDLYINGLIIQKETSTETFNEQNFLRVRRKLQAGSQVELTPDYASHTNANLKVFGGAGIRKTLHIGARGSGEGLFIGKLNSGSDIEFQVIGDTGNTTIGRSGAGSATEGLLTVYGDTLLDRNVVITGTTEINNTLDVDNNFAVRTSGGVDKFTVASASGNTVIEGTLNGKGAADFDSTLNVDGNTTLGGTLTVTGTTEFNNTVDVDANFAVRNGSTDKMTVASSTGNIATDGTLVVQGQTTINDSLIVDAANEIFSVRNGSGVEKFGVDADNGNTNIIGTLTVGDATQINDTFGVSGVTTLTANSQQTLTGTYGADGAFRLTGGAGIGKNLAVGGAARIYGATEINGALDLNNSADISGALVTHDNVTITADNKFFKIQTGSAVDKFTVDTDNGNTTIAGTLGITGDVTASSDLTVTGNLIVNGTTTTVNSTVVTLDDPIITLGGNTAPASNDGKDRGVEFRYYDSSAKVGFFGLDRSSLEYVFLTDATNSSEVHTGTDGALRAGSLNLTGSGTALDVDANANIDGTLTVDGQIISQVTSGPALVIPTTAKINNLNADLLDSMTTASANTASTVVARDSNGDFAANQITAASGVGAAAGFLGNASSADILKTARVITIDGVVNGNVSFDGSQAVTITTTYDDADITALAAMAGTGYVVRTAANTYAQRTFSVTASSGITLTNPDGIAGNTTINVASASTNAANNLVLRDASGGFSAEDVNVATLDTTGNSTIGGTLGVTGVVTLSGELNANSGIKVDTTKFTVDGQNGSVSTEGTLNADGAVTFGSTLTVANNTEINGTLDVDNNFAVRTSGGVDKFTVLGASGNTSIAGTLGVTGAATLSSTLGVTGATTLSSTLAVTGTSIFTGEISANGGIALGDTDKATFGDDDDLQIFWSGTQNRIDTANGPLQIRNSHSSGIQFFDGDNTNFMFKALPLGAVELYHSGTKTFETTATGATLTGVLVATSMTGNVTGQVSDISNHDTDALSEGSTNLYFTNERVDDRIDALFVAGTGITKVYDDAANTYTLSVTQADIDTDNITEGSTNIFFTNARSDARFDTKLAAADTDDLSEGSTNLYYTDARADARIAAATTDDLTEGGNLYYTDARADARVAAATGANLDLSGKSTTDLSEGTNQYYTEARVQAKLDNAFAQLSAMLNNLATTTTLTLNLSGDPTPGAVVTTGVSSGGLGGFTAGTAVATTGGTGSALTVDTTVVNGAITAAAVNAGGSDYLITDTVTITNPNLGGVATFNFGALVGGTQYTTGTALATTGGDGSNLTVDITASGGSVTNVTVNAAGSGYAIGNTVTIVHPNATGIATVDTIGAADASRTAGTYNVTAFSTTGSGTSSEFQIVVDGSGAATVTVTTPGTGHAVDDTITISDANLGGGGAANLTFDVATIYTSDATIDLSTVFTNATLSLTDITTMEVGATVTGATSGTTGIITALGTNQITVDNVDGFFKVGEVVSANDVTTLTISTFS